MRRVSLLLSLVLGSVLPAAAQKIVTVAGNGTGGFSGDGGPATSAQLQFQVGVARDTAGNLWIADSGNQRIRRVDGTTGFISTVAGTGLAGFSGDGGAASAAQVADPQDVAVDAAGNVYIADTSNHRIRRIDAMSGIITTVAGDGVPGFGGDGGPATSAQLMFPTGVAVDSAGNLYIADFGNQRVRRVRASNGNIDTIAGTGVSGFSGDGGPGTSAQVADPFGVAVDGAGNVFIADSTNNRVRRVDAASGTIATVAGDGTAGFGGDGGPAASAQLSFPTGVTVDGAGSLYIADFLNLRVRRVDGMGTITTFAGDGTRGYTGDNGPPTSAQLSDPASVYVDAAFNLFISDTGNNAVRQVFGPADLTVTKTDSPDPIPVGNDLTYTVVVDNAGPNAATMVTLTDPLPAASSFQSLTSPAGWVCTTPAVGSSGTISCTNPSVPMGGASTFTMIVRPAAGAVGTLSNTVTVSSADQPDSNGANNSATATTTVNAAADLNVTKTDSPDPVDVNTDLTYTVMVTNLGPNDATNVSLSDPLPAGTTFQSATVPTGWTCTTPGVGAGGTISCTNPSLAASASSTFTVVIRPGGTSATSISNTVTVSSQETDPVTADNSTTTTTAVNHMADLALTKSDSPDPVTVGSNLTYTITVTNGGPSIATGVMLTDTLPAGVTLVSSSTTVGSCSGAVTVTCNIGALNSGASANVTIVVQPTAVGSPSNTASASSSVTDPNNANDSATATTTVNAAPDFSLGVSPASTTVPSGMAASATVTVTPNPAPFANAVALSCGSLPPLASCSFNPASVTPGLNPATSQLTIRTDGSVNALSNPTFTGRLVWPPMVGAFLAAAVLLLLRRQTPSQKLTYALLLVFLVSLLIGQAACLSSNETTPPGTYNITITGTSGSTARTTTLTLIVQ